MCNPLSLSVSVMSVSPALSDLSRLYQTEFVRSARAVGVLWAICTLCFAIIQVVVLVQPSWIGTADIRQQGAPSGTLGLFEVRGGGTERSLFGHLFLTCFFTCSSPVCVLRCAWSQTGQSQTVVAVFPVCLLSRPSSRWRCWWACPCGRCGPASSVSVSSGSAAPPPSTRSAPGYSSPQVSVWRWPVFCSQTRGRVQR
uniref:LHFPL tetraspan subfamily member 4b n=1 Tax=Lates calcarifer TaxID=8187 RepID=A0A4W6EJ73_LATCA